MTSVHPCNFFFSKFDLKHVDIEPGLYASLLRRSDQTFCLLPWGSWSTAWESLLWVEAATTDYQPRRVVKRFKHDEELHYFCFQCCRFPEQHCLTWRFQVSFARPSDKSGVKTREIRIFVQCYRQSERNIEHDIHVNHANKFGVYLTGNMAFWELGFSDLHCWGVMVGGTWRFVVGWVVLDVSYDRRPWR